jgi:hypothetical protein
MVYSIIGVKLFCSCLLYMVYCTIGVKLFCSCLLYMVYCTIGVKLFCFIYIFMSFVHVYNAIRVKLLLLFFCIWHTVSLEYNYYSYVLVICIVLLCVFTFWVPCCDVRYDFRIKAMFGSSLPPVICRMAHVLFMSFVFVCVYWCSPNIVSCFCIHGKIILLMSFVHGILYHWSKIILLMSFVHGILYHWSTLILLRSFVHGIQCH